MVQRPVLIFVQFDFLFSISYEKKSSAVGFFGVAQSPKSSYGGTLVIVTSLFRVSRAFSKKIEIYVTLTKREK